MIAIRQKLRFRSRPKADWYFNHWSVFLVWSWSQSQGWIFCPKSKIFTYHRGQVLNFEQNIHPCDWDDDQTRNTLEWLKYQSAQGLDWKLNFCLIAITIGPEEYLIRALVASEFENDQATNGVSRALLLRSELKIWNAFLFHSKLWSWEALFNVSRDPLRRRPKKCTRIAFVEESYFNAKFAKLSIFVFCLMLNLIFESKFAARCT